MFGAIEHCTYLLFVLPNWAGAFTLDVQNGIPLVPSNPHRDISRVSDVQQLKVGVCYSKMYRKFHLLFYCNVRGGMNVVLTCFCFSVLVIV